MRAAARRFLAAPLCVALAVAVASCTGSDKRPGELKLFTDDFVLRVNADPTPPKALEQITWTVVINDRESGMPIDGGEGRIFATSRDGKNIDNGFEPTGELGTYRTRLLFITAGMWAMGIQFRADSTLPLQRTQDWSQDVLSADEPGDFSPPLSTPVEPPTRDDTTAADSVRRDTPSTPAR